ncbi:MAG: hypothetical protein FWE67_04430 [Planctomycetaceae bacterium]|nr:hypothetical protein [Planctomycetaceae bacterium]
MLNAAEHFIQQRTKNKLELKAHGKFTILFSLLDRLTKTPQKSMATWGEQDWTYDELDKQARYNGKKKTFSVYSDERLSFRDYFFSLDTDPKIKKVPIMSAAVVPTTGESRRFGKVSSNFIGSIKIASLDFQDQMKSFLQSSLPTSHEICMTTQNYKSILAGYALYQSVTFDWRNDADIFYAPYRNFSSL